MKKIVVLVSGGGSNLQSILDHCTSNEIQGQVIAVISNRPNAMGLQRAVKAGADAITLDHKQFETRASFDDALSRRIDFYQPDLIILAGFMRILTDEFVNRHLGKMINIHPSLLPKYPGLHTHRRALEAKDNHAGATVHYVTPELDGGPLVLQSEVKIDENEDELSLSKKVLATEHQLYPTVVKWICEGRLTFAEGLPVLDGETLLFPLKMDNTSL